MGSPSGEPITSEVNMIFYIGKITDLIPMGFTFHKLYAMNYKAYNHEDTDMWIYVKGRDVHFNNLRHKEFSTVFEMIINDEYPLYERKIMHGEMVFFKKGDPQLCISDRETGEIISHNAFMAKWKPEFPDYEDYWEFKVSGRFNDICMHKRHLDFVKLMHGRNMLENR